MLLYITQCQLLTLLYYTYIHISSPEPLSKCVHNCIANSQKNPAM